MGGQAAVPRRRRRRGAPVKEMRRTLARAAAASALLVGLLVAAPGATLAADPIVVHGIVPLTGAGAFIGLGQKATLDVVVDTVNRSGGIDGRNLQIVLHDDQTSPQVAVQLLNQIMAEHPAVVLGSSLVAACNAMAPLAASGPVIYCMSPGFHPRPGSFAFSSGVSTFDQMAALMRFFRAKGWIRIASISGIDASGLDADEALEAALRLPESRGLTLVEHQHFEAKDVSVAAQIERIKSQKPDVLIAWATGSPIATILRAVAQAELDIPIASTTGNELGKQMEQYARFLPKQFLIPSTLFPAHPGIQLEPKVEGAQQAMYPALAAHDLAVDNFIGTSWDVGLIVAEAFKRFGAQMTAEQLRTYIASLKDFPGVDGLYDFTAHTERGLGLANVAVVTYSPAKRGWVWLSHPGGEPLEN